MVKYRKEHTRPKSSLVSLRIVGSLAVLLDYHLLGLTIFHLATGLEGRCSPALAVSSDSAMSWVPSSSLTPDVRQTLGAWTPWARRPAVCRSSFLSNAFSLFDVSSSK